MTTLPIMGRPIESLSSWWFTLRDYRPDGRPGNFGRCPHGKVKQLTRDAAALQVARTYGVAVYDVLLDKEGAIVGLAESDAEHLTPGERGELVAWCINPPAAGQSIRCSMPIDGIKADLALAVAGEIEGGQG